MRRRSTLSSPVEFAGTGLHGGKPCRVRVEPSEERGFWFAGPGGDESLLGARWSFSARRSGLAFPGGGEMQTGEHLLAALWGLEIDDARIVLEGEEVPILDGSAAPFAEALAPRRREKEEKVVPLLLPVPVAVDEPERGRTIAAFPSDVLRLTVVLDYPDTPIGTLLETWTLDREVFARTVAPARTFGLTRELQDLEARGLARGGSLENALVVDERGPLNPREGVPFRQECLRHKMLDLMGDLALLGLPLTAHVVALRSGHQSHQALVDRLRPYALAALGTMAS
ncbi:UDP-3-O-acyl-N-acetylglucosamine deacetylase [Aminomonas paucivorans]|uniref:UDP-3-O-acyl-N-acetylglucosamine deacetylase n=1 Tax=Aminomonas paucivorans TaxID=81412 RepID=UPI0033257C0C